MVAKCMFVGFTTKRAAREFAAAMDARGFDGRGNGRRWDSESAEAIEAASNVTAEMQHGREVVTRHFRLEGSAWIADV